MASKFVTVGWQGITLQTPEDWNLVGISGDEKKGYFRVDAPFTSAVEVRWSSVKEAPDLQKRVKEFLDTVEKAARKRRAKFTSKIVDRKPSDAQFKANVGLVGFSWRGDRKGYGVLMHCSLCKRVVIAQVISELDEDVSTIADRILTSLSDHSEAGWVDWALYDLQTAVPEEFKLEKQTLMSAYVALHFRSKYSELTVERWGLANTLLKRTEMAEWFRKDSLPDYKEFRVAIEPAEATEGREDHQALKVSGRRRGIRQMLKMAVKSLTLRPLPAQVTSYVWHCPESNRLFAVKLVHNASPRVLEEVRARTRCH